MQKKKIDKIKKKNQQLLTRLPNMWPCFQSSSLVSYNSIIQSLQI